MSTTVICTIAELRQSLCEARRQGRRIGCVPTMGALHAGHASLIQRARADTDVVVVTIFVNPIQFDRREDYERYARNLDADRALCESLGVDLIFAPSVEEMYPRSPATFVESPRLAEHLCGSFRPGHFRGVATVVAKLFNMVQPDVAYFGEKDAQQLAIIEHMVEDLNFPVTIVRVATVREPDGLALSSRNQRLSPEERAQAPALYAALCEARRLLLSGERSAVRLRRAVLDHLSRYPLIRPEYVEVVDRQMQPVEEVRSTVRIAAAIWLGDTRLIDNLECPLP
jgi:pantoate--beta-alanine ligase